MYIHKTKFQFFFQQQFSSIQFSIYFFQVGTRTPRFGHAQMDNTVVNICHEVKRAKHAPYSLLLKNVHVFRHTRSDSSVTFCSHGTFQAQGPLFTSCFPLRTLDARHLIARKGSENHQAFIFVIYLFSQLFIFSLFSLTHSLYA